MTRQLPLFESIKLPSDSARPIYSRAVFSPCRIYRYQLVRQWDSSRPTVAFVGLNPSTADETKDDPTIRRCVRFAKDWGCGELIMLNAYAFRDTDPRGMKAAPDPIGPLNDRVIDGTAKSVALVIAAWGVHCEPSRELAVCRAIGRPIHCLGTTKAGRPKHPLYLKSSTKPVLFWEPSQ